MVRVKTSLLRLGDLCSHGYSYSASLLRLGNNQSHDSKQPMLTVDRKRETNMSGFNMSLMLKPDILLTVQPTQPLPSMDFVAL